ncbi:DUF536 domain-containing protein [Staphylococcus epidermidis]|uniref:DUF536 domain-containing protein n=1 Tax=Staphylococcus epidermidis TaxID=1282 RepID=UPI002480A262|nr:DUF536 domain-containing protein [Staphylococcus epidermidis]MCG1083382.1 DUF536 domain-containing protein [Staphylococcus epidermidis]MCG1189711.1 DUF536 domain-containing protein [Staphylococcus epidermidis]MDH8855172.1 DUF536 domain-containing protein [Staphylococcus epidermidis]MDT0743490.1 DUF536 domain-containing protein [Staphylococcus epidermidis]
MKTIKMVADELNVTKQTVVNNAKNLNISFKKENGVNYIDDNDYLKIIEKITKKERTTQNKGSEKKEITYENTAEVEENRYNNSDVSETLKTKVNELEKQIEIFETRAKNDEKYIENLTKQLDQQNSNVNTLNKLLENQQILALESNKKIQKLEHQLEEERQLNYSLDKSTNNRKNFDVQEASYTSDSIKTDQYREKEKNPEVQLKDISENRQDEEPQTKKGFWSRLFGS